LQSCLIFQPQLSKCFFVAWTRFKEEEDVLL
jgi:hypothetical protein